MTPEVFLKSQLARFAQQEAGYIGGQTAMLAVLCILRNRVTAGWYGGDWLQNMNFAADRAALEPVAPPPVEMSSLAFRSVLAAVEDIYPGTYKDEITAGGLYYFDPHYAEHGRTLRRWFVDEVMHKRPRVAQVGAIWIFG